jgi:hypothetical protein
MKESTYFLWSLVLQGFGFAGVIGTLILLWRQTRHNAEAVEMSAFSSAASRAMEVGKLFVDKPYLRKYFYDGEPVPKTPQEYDEVKAAAIVMLDFFADILIYSRQYPNLYPEAPWRNYVEDMFFFSPMLREVLTQLERTNRKWYVDELYDFKSKAIQRWERSSESVQTVPDRH